MLPFTTLNYSKVREDACQRLRCKKKHFFYTLTRLKTRTTLLLNSLIYQDKMFVFKYAFLFLKSFKKKNFLVNWRKLIQQLFFFARPHYKAIYDTPYLPLIVSSSLTGITNNVVKLS